MDTRLQVWSLIGGQLLQNGTGSNGSLAEIFGEGKMMANRDDHEVYVRYCP